MCHSVRLCPLSVDLCSIQRAELIGRRNSWTVKVSSRPSSRPPSICPIPVIRCTVPLTHQKRDHFPRESGAHPPEPKAASLRNQWNQLHRNPPLIKEKSELQLQALIKS